MSEMQELSVNFSTVDELIQVPRVEDDIVQPPKKKLKAELNTSSKDKKLEDRLSGILCCTVCLDLPKVYCWQCNNGHLMCSACFNHLLADARLKNETSTCPTCRCEISKAGCSRNLAVENAVSELPTMCRHCGVNLPLYSIAKHELELCPERPSECKYALIGCSWVGPYHELANHESSCSSPHLNGQQIMQSLAVKRDKHLTTIRKIQKVFDMLAYEKISINDIQLRPYRTDGYITRLYYESSRISALNLEWLVKARAVSPHSEPTHSCDRSLEFQLCLKSKVSNPVSLHFIPLHGPFCDIPMRNVIYDYEFTNDKVETDFLALPVIDAFECNKLLAAKTINIRLVIFQE